MPTAASNSPSSVPLANRTKIESAEPSSTPLSTPSVVASEGPPRFSSAQPSNDPSDEPSAIPSQLPSLHLSHAPSFVPSYGRDSLQVIELIFVNAVTNEDIPGAFDCFPYLCENEAVLVNICAKTIGHVKSVWLGLTGPVTEQPRVENVAPYALFGDFNGNFNGVVLKPGKYNMTAEPFSQIDAGGTSGPEVTVQFNIAEPSPQPSTTTSIEPSLEASGISTYVPSLLPSSNPSEADSSSPSSQPTEAGCLPAASHNSCLLKLQVRYRVV